MKKILIPVIAVFIVIVLFFGGAIWLKDDQLAYERELVKHFAVAMSEGGIRAVENGVTTYLADSNSEKLRPVLCRAERSYEPFRRRTEGARVIELYVDDEMTIVVEEPDPNVDTVYIYYTCGSKQRTLSISGYQTMRWVDSIVSPEGYYGPNTTAE